jgi:hypothetical protein
VADKYAIVETGFEAIMDEDSMAPQKYGRRSMAWLAAMTAIAVGVPASIRATEPVKEPKPIIEPSLVQPTDVAPASATSGDSAASDASGDSAISATLGVVAASGASETVSDGGMLWIDDSVVEEPVIEIDADGQHGSMDNPFDSMRELSIAQSAGSELGFGDWLGYNSTDSDWTWIAARNDLGIFSLQSFPTLEIGEKTSFETGMGVHFLSGPTVTDLPPRLFDLEMALRTRRLVGDSTMFDLKVGVGAFTDFEGSSREGIRFPGHAVAYHEVDPWMIAVLGVDVLDRDDISLLPVVGTIYRPNQDLICELVFPRPRLQYRISDAKSLYLSGELGGGTWAVERVGGIDDVATYRDLRVACGVMDWGKHHETVLEIGYAFARALEFRSGNGDYDPDGALMLRLRSHF